MHKYIFNIRWLYCCLIFFGYSCRQDKPLAYTSAIQDSTQYKKNISYAFLQIDSLQKVIQEADVITRTGNDFTSESLRNLNQKDKTFSHCGIASVENDSLFIYHSLGGEWNPDQIIMRESFKNFAEPYSNKTIGIFRPALTPSEKQSLVAAARSLREKKTTFDMDFDLKTDDKMYCAEFVYKSFIAATDSVVQFHHSFIRQFEFIGVDDITGNKLFKKISVLKYRIYN